MIIIIVIMLDVFTTLFIFIPMIFSSVFYFTSKLLKTHAYEKLLNAHEYELNTTKVSKFPSLIVLFTWTNCLLSFLSILLFRLFNLLLVRF